MPAELIRIFIKYHVDMTRRVWDSINQITDEQFDQDFIMWLWSRNELSRLWRT